MNAKSTQTQTSSGTQNTQSNPWGPQQPYLLNAFNGSQGALNQAQNNAVIPQNFVAQYSPDQISAFQQMLTSGLNQGVPNSSASAGGILSSAGATGAQQGLSKLATWTPQGTPQSIIDQANQYASNANISPMVEAAMRDANNEAQYVTKPGIDASAAGSGNINSSRTAIEQGLVDKGLAERAADISANLRGTEYNSGLTLAQQMAQNNNSNQLAALLGLTQGGATTANAGTAANTGSVGQSGGLYNIAGQGITGGYNAAQAPLSNQLQQFLNNSNDPFTALQNFYNIIGNKSWGGNTNQQSNGTQTTTTTPSTLAQIGGWTNFAGSLLSDKRMKTDIEDVGMLDNGLFVYRYRYVGDDKTWHIGLLAQEVEERNPAAVTERDGVKYVNYKLATE